MHNINKKREEEKKERTVFLVVTNHALHLCIFQVIMIRKRKTTITLAHTKW